jgi:hypothetical protein
MKKVKKVKNNWVNGEVLHFIALKGEMELEFAQKNKKNVNFVFILEFFFNFETLNVHINII